MVCDNESIITNILDWSKYHFIHEILEPQKVGAICMYMLFSLAIKIVDMQSASYGKGADHQVLHLDMDGEAVRARIEPIAVPASSRSSSTLSKG